MLTITSGCEKQRQRFDAASVLTQQLHQDRCVLRLDELQRQVLQLIEPGSTVRKEYSRLSARMMLQQQSSLQGSLPPSAEAGGAAYNSRRPLRPCIDKLFSREVLAEPNAI